MRARTVTGLIVGNALLVSAAPPPLPGQASRRAPPAAQVDRSPVRCVASDDARPAGRPRGRWLEPMRAVVPITSLASPPAPPPPPPASASLPGAADVVVTGNLVTGPIRPYGSLANTERYAGEPVAGIHDVAAEPVSTFSVDVDTGAYANARRFLMQGQPVPAEAVRTEEMINYFRYDYPRPTDRSAPFSVTTDVTTTPWNPDTRLLRIGLRGYDVSTATRPPANLVFLIDTSGSMASDDKLPLVREALAGLADRLRPDDRIAIVAYAGSAGIVLEPTADRDAVKAALTCLEAGGSTAGGEGIALAYATARAHFRAGGINRIFLATDGDFNVGVSDTKTLEALIKRNRDDGITLTTLGFGTGNYNEAMMERIADVGNGNYAYIDSAMEARKVLGDELSATLVTIASDVKVQVEFNPAAVAQYRLIGYENRALAEEDFTNDAVDAGDIGAGHQVTALYEVVPAGNRGWTPPRRYPANRTPAPAGGGELGIVRLRYTLPRGGPSREIDRPVPSALLRTARPPQGDAAFAVAVAAYGQKLRGDTHLGGYSFVDIRTLAGRQTDEWRGEFVKLVELAQTHAAPARDDD